MGSVSTDLRQAVLQAAMQGKLTEQLPEDGNARDLLKQIKVEKERLIKEKKIKKEKELAPITEDEIPFDIPDNWEWVKFGEISTYGQSKQKIKATDANPNCWMLDLEDIERGGRLLSKLKVSDKKAVGDKTCFYKGDLLYSKLRPYLLKILIADEHGICTPELVPFRLYCEINDKFVIYCLKSPYIDISVNKVTYGEKMPRVGTDTMLNLLIPLPPLAEQKRIVARVEELMAKIDELEVIENNLRELHQAFPNDMKASLLQAAMQGKLTEQLSGDTSPYKLKLKYEDADKNDLTIPDSWACVKFSELADNRMGKTILRKDLKNIGIPVYSATMDGKPFGYLDSVELVLHKDELVIPARGCIGFVKIIEDEVATCTQTTICCQNLRNIYPRYLFMACKAFKDKWFKSTGSAIPQLTVSQVNNCVVPLPPIEEQKRIVEKLDRLLPLCDSLQNKL